MRYLLTFSLLIMSHLASAQPATCCAHWDAAGVCRHEYTCAEPSPTREDDDVIYTRNNDGDLTRSCCAHWGADNVCHHEYQC